jgi:DNA repair protein RecO (recombination protein O)
MEWSDEAIVLGLRRYGETSAIVECMTAAHGRHLGLVRGGRSRRMRPILQPGNRIDVTWRARLDEHLGSFQVEPVAFNAARLLESAVAVNGMQTLAAHLRLLPERDPHYRLYEILNLTLDLLDDPPACAELVARFELALLDELGFGLDLQKCVATGVNDDLAYVSPKSGRAVSRSAGDPWSDKLLLLPQFLRRGSQERPDSQALERAFVLTGFFFHRHVYEPRGMEEPPARRAFLKLVGRSRAGASGQESAEHEQ